MINKSIFTKSLFERPESLSKYLPYDEYYDEQGFFILKDGVFGVVLKATLLEHEPMKSQQISEAVNNLKSWFNLNSGYTLQVTFDQKKVSPFDKKWKGFEDEYENGHIISTKLFEEKLKSLRNSENLPFERVLYISIKKCTLSSRKSFLGFCKNGEQLLLDETKLFLKESRLFTNEIQDFISNSSLDLRKINGDELIDLLRKEFNPKTYYKREFASYNPIHSISDQIIFNSPMLDFEGINREGIKTRAISLKMAPSYAYPGGTASFLTLNFPYKISICFSFPEKEKIKKFYDIKEFLLDKAQSAKSKRQLNEIREAQERLAHDDRVLYMTYTVIIEGETEQELDEKERQIANIFNNKLESEVISDKDIGLGLYLNSLPLNYSPEADLSTARFIRILRSDATKFIPIFDSYRGLNYPLQVMRSRENNLVPFNLIENETSNHSVVIADSGSGKSAFIIDCVQSMKRMNPEPLIFAIEKKSSHKIIGQYFDAEITVFHPNEDIPFSPFRGIYDEAKITFLTQLLSSAIKLTSPSFIIESEHIASITKALKLAYQNSLTQNGLKFVDGKLIESDEEKNVEVTMDSFISELSGLTSHSEYESLEDQIEDILNKLKPFYGDGLYAKYFKTGANLKDHNNTRYFIYDLDALDSDPILQELMTMSVIEEIRQVIQLPQNQGRGGFVIIEELGMLGRTNQAASNFIIDAAETFRKLGVFLIGLTPRPENYFEIDAGRAMWQVADNYIFLKMGSDNVEYLKQKSTLLDEAQGKRMKYSLIYPKTSV